MSIINLQLFVEGSSPSYFFEIRDYDNPAIIYYSDTWNPNLGFGVNQMGVLLNQTDKCFTISGSALIPQTNNLQLTGACYNFLRITNNTDLVTPESPNAIAFGIRNPPNNAGAINLPSNLSPGAFIDIEVSMSFDPLSVVNEWQLGTCCIHESSLVKTLEGLKPIRDVKSGDQVMNYKGEFVDVKYNIKHHAKQTRFVKIGKNSLGKNIPYQDLLITENHPILISNQEIQPEYLLNDNIRRIDIPESEIYTLVTLKKDFIICQGIPVASYSHNYWKKFSQENNKIWEKL